MQNTREEGQYDQWQRLESERIAIRNGESDDEDQERRYELIVSQQEWRVQIRRKGKDHFGGNYFEDNQAKEAAQRLRTRLFLQKDVSSNS